MKTYLSYLLISLLALGFFISCDETSTEEEVDTFVPSQDICFDEDAPPRNTDKVTIQQGIWGDVWFWSGDFMPPRFGEICLAKRRILIYELTTFDDVELDGPGGFYLSINTTLVKKVTSDESGFFEVELEPGTYSIFIEENGNLYANRFFRGGIFPVTVETDGVSEIRFDITYDRST